ncbi:MAG: hypothetical protein AAFO94_19810, partial [Bacteroidota bacterium]
DEQPIAAFLLRGSQQCGQEFLKDRLLSRVNIGSDRKEILIDFATQANGIPTVQDIWQILKEKLSKISAFEPEGIAEDIFQQYFSMGQHIVMVFNNIDTIPGDLRSALIKEFWFKLSNWLDELIDGPSDTRVYLFLLDKNCSVAPGAATPGVNAQFYEQQFEAAELEKHHLFLLPIVSWVEGPYLSKWRDQQELPVPLGLKDEILQALVGDAGKPVIPAVKSICEHANFIDIYTTNFLQYEYKT